MPGWVVPVLSAILGSSVVGSIAVAWLSHYFQQQRDRETNQRAAHAAQVAQRRALCTTLLETVIRHRSWLHNIESIHDNRATRLSVRRQFRPMYKDLTASLEHVQKWRAEFDLEPDARIQKALDGYSDALIAYQQALLRPFSSPWNPFQLYFAKTPPEELQPLAHECEVQTHLLQDAVRDYLATLEPPPSPAQPRDSRLPLWLRATRKTRV